jgi:hypothetical protein
MYTVVFPTMARAFWQHDFFNPLSNPLSLAAL